MIRDKLKSINISPDSVKYIHNMVTGKIEYEETYDSMRTITARYSETSALINVGEFIKLPTRVKIKARQGRLAHVMSFGEIKRTDIYYLYYPASPKFKEWINDRKKSNRS